MKNLLFFSFSFFLLFSCKGDDPCDTFICMNGGVLENCQCTCTERYQGPDCSVQKTPALIKVSKITITKFPTTTETGGSWDTFDGADIYVRITSSTGNTIYDAPTFYEDATNPNGNYSFDTDINLSAETTYDFEVLDYDDGITDDDYMGGITGKVYDSKNNFPSTLDFTCEGCSTSFRLELEYEF